MHHCQSLWNKHFLNELFQNKNGEELKRILPHPQYMKYVNLIISIVYKIYHFLHRKKARHQCTWVDVM